MLEIRYFSHLITEYLIHHEDSTQNTASIKGLEMHRKQWIRGKISNAFADSPKDKLPVKMDTFAIHSPHMQTNVCMYSLLTQISSKVSRIFP